jgi:hypothetical protein
MIVDGMLLADGLIGPVNVRENFAGWLIKPHIGTQFHLPYLSPDSRRAREIGFVL